MRDADGLQVLAWSAQLARAERVVALEGDLADLDRRAFLDVEGQRDGGGRDGLDIGPDGGELVAVLAEHLLQHDFGALDARGIVLAFDGEADLFLLEAVEHVGNGDGVQALVVDFANGGLFADVDDELHAVGLVDALDAHVVEVAGVPERVEVALHNGGIVRVAGRENRRARMDSLGMRRLPMTCVWQRICGALAAGNCGLACTWAAAAGPIIQTAETEGCRGGSPQGGAMDAEAAGARAHRLGRTVAGELALTRIPVKITTPSLLFESSTLRFRRGSLRL